MTATRKIRGLVSGVFSVGLLFAMPVSAQSKFPEKPINIIVPFSAGGATDMLARTVGEKLSKLWEQPVIVDNRPGAGGNIGALAGARAAPDGYTLTLTAAGISTVNPHVYDNLEYDSITDFSPVTMLVEAPLLLAVHPSVGITTFSEWLEKVRENPGKYTVANGGVGTAQHLGAEYLDMEAEMQSLHIPYKGSAPATADILGGHVDATIDNMVTLIPPIKSGKLVPLAVTSLERVDALPDVPTANEAGLPGFQTGSWYGLVAPAGTPEEIVNKYQSEIAAIVATEEIQEMLKKQGLVPVASTPEEFSKRIRDDREKMGHIVKEAGVEIN